MFKVQRTLSYFGKSIPWWKVRLAEKLQRRPQTSGEKALLIGTLCFTETDAYQQLNVQIWRPTKNILAMIQAIWERIPCLKQGDGSDHPILSCLLPSTSAIRSAVLDIRLIIQNTSIN